MIVRDVFEWAKHSLSPSNTASIDAQSIIAAVMGYEAYHIYSRYDAPVSKDQFRCIKDFVLRRSSCEPISKIIGKRWFYESEFIINKNVLDPRPETETIVELALNIFGHCSNKAITFADLGTGSGCIAISLLQRWKNAKASAVDISREALSVAKQNALIHGVIDRIKFEEASFDDSWGDGFDLIVSNPPYVSDSDFDILSPEVRNFDPSLALLGSNGGYKLIEKVITISRRVLASRGYFIMEFGYNQASQVSLFLDNLDFDAIMIHKDVFGKDRVVSARLPV